MFFYKTKKFARAVSLYLFICLMIILPKAEAAEIQDVPPPDKPGIVLVLSGGGTKGIAHIGVLKVLEEMNVPIAGIVGASMGSIFGGLYACGYNSSELYEIINTSNFINLISDRYVTSRLDTGDSRPPGAPANLFRLDRNARGDVVGPIGGMTAVGLYNYLGELVNEKYAGPTFNDLKIPFAAVATDIERGETVVLRQGNLNGAMRASMAYPGLFDPWHLDGKMLVDGGLLANLPVSVAKEAFPGHLILAVNVSPVEKFVSRDSIHTLASVLIRSISIVTDKITEEEEKLADLLIVPKTHGLGLLDATGYDKIMALGEDAARAMSADIAALVQRSSSYSGYITSADAPFKPTPTVKRLVVEGLPVAMQEDIYNTYVHWVGKPLDVSALNKAVEKLSRREGFSTVDGHISEDEDGDGSATVVLNIQRRPNQTIGIDGYTTNLHQQRWIQFNAVKRDLLGDGDAAEFLLRWGSNWGIQAKYFTRYQGNAQWGMSFSARSEEYSPINLGAITHKWNRYALKAARYWDTGRIRFGIGAIAESINGAGKNADNYGPYAHFSYENVDNSLYPTKGFAVIADAWLPIDENPLSKAVFQAYRPLPKDTRLSLKVGIETGDKATPAHRAYLGDQEELYGYADHPLTGDQAFWLNLGIGKALMRSWWGQVHGEIFGTWGAVFNSWKRTQEAWEAGIALSVPGQFLNGKILVVYDQKGDVTFGFSIGDLKIWNNPLP